MTNWQEIAGRLGLNEVPARQPILIAGPTASGKSDLALQISETFGGVIVNADASQVYDCWRVISARPGPGDLARAKHCLYGHVAATDPYSAGHWLREVAPLLGHAERPIIVGGTGLYFSALTKGLADIPATPAAIRATGDALDLGTMLAVLDPATVSRIDNRNRARVQRAWEVFQSTGQGLAAWQDRTGPPLLPRAHCTAIVFQSDPDWLAARIEQRFDQMLEQGALDEVRAQLDFYDPTLPAHRAIGVPEIMAHLKGAISLAQAKSDAVIATRQFAKRQRTWFRSKMRDWIAFDPSN
ncbi:MAG: tRNA (adenosine(37)-N6)-dimethylallyltransferase MiaA [Sulfitobacter sp.]